MHYDSTVKMLKERFPFLSKDAVPLSSNCGPEMVEYLLEFEAYSDRKEAELFLKKYFHRREYVLAIVGSSNQDRRYDLNGKRTKEKIHAWEKVKYVKLLNANDIQHLPIPAQVFVDQVNERSIERECRKIRKANALLDAGYSMDVVEDLAGKVAKSVFEKRKNNLRESPLYSDVEDAKKFREQFDTLCNSQQQEVLNSLFEKSIHPSLIELVTGRKQSSLAYEYLCYLQSNGKLNTN